MTKSVQQVKELLSDKLMRYFATTPEAATKEQMYKAVALVTRDILLKKKQENNIKTVKNRRKRVYYLCMEFLLGRQMRNNLWNLGLEDPFRAALADYDCDLDALYDMEADAGLGNGRSGAGSPPALGTASPPSITRPWAFPSATEYGLFKQKIVDHQQVERPISGWIGRSRMMPRSDKSLPSGSAGMCAKSGSARAPHRA